MLTYKNLRWSPSYLGLPAVSFYYRLTTSFCKNKNTTPHYGALDENISDLWDITKITRKNISLPNYKTIDNTKISISEKILFVSLNRPYKVICDFGLKTKWHRPRCKTCQKNKFAKWNKVKKSTIVA